MIIGIDASRANKKERTGTEWYSYFVIEELKKIGSSDRFCLYSKTPLEGDLGALPANFESRILSWPPGYLWTQARLGLEMLMHPPNALFVPAHALPVLARTRTVVTIHDVGFDAYPELYSRADIAYHRFCVRFASARADRIICPSEFTKNELVKYYRTDERKITVIAHGVRSAEYSSDPAGRGDYFLFTGRLEKKKNIMAIVQAFESAHAKHGNLRLVLAGRAGHGWDDVNRYIAEKDLRSAVEVTGYITEEKKRQLYARAIGFVFPTLYEGFGMPILEAQAAGCPVITSNSGAVSEVAGVAALLVDPHNTDEVASAMCDLYQKEDLRSDLAQKGRLNAQRYSWEKCAALTLAAIRS